MSEKEIQVKEEFKNNKCNNNIIKFETKVSGAGVYFGDNEHLEVTISGSNERKLEKFTEELIKRWNLIERAKKLMVEFNSMGAYGESMAIQDALDLNKEEANKIAEEIRNGKT
ncbi:MAG TPA: hypothetical protein ENI23_12940 [bacterium]|nr:hypothetical protein [bacterium]